MTMRVLHMLAALSLGASAVALAAGADDYSAQLDALWNYDQPAASQARFASEATKYHAGTREALEIATQVARTQGLQRKFAEADATLDATAQRLLDVSPADALPRVRVRYLLERGRTRNSGGNPQAAAALFKEAVAVSRDDTLPGADFYRVDALHMLGIAAPKDERLAWNLRALAVAEASGDARARGWAASLHNNIGWTYFGAGDTATALAHWQQALVLREAAGKPGAITVARWTVARGYRATGRLDDAQRIQLDLAAQTERAGEPDGYVYEELAEIEIARGNAKAAAGWAAKAHALLKDDAGLAADEPARIARLAAIAKASTP